MLATITIGIDPIAFRIGSLAVHWYGIMYVVAFVAAYYLGARPHAEGAVDAGQVGGEGEAGIQTLGREDLPEQAAHQRLEAGLAPAGPLGQGLHLAVGPLYFWTVLRTK